MFLLQVIIGSSRIYIVQVLADHGDLFNYTLGTLAWIDENVRERRVAILFSQLVSAVRHIHSKRVVHRDIKPENCLIKANGDLLLTDFGNAVEVQPGTESSLQMWVLSGTPQYLAPETLRMQVIDPFKVDTWALGCTLYFMLTGSNLFNVQTVPEVSDSSPCPQVP